MSSLLDSLKALGIDPEDFEWRDLALCMNYDIPNHKKDAFFDLYESDEETAKAVDSMCLSCPVMKQCFMTGVEGSNYGVYGGVYWNGAGKPDKNKNSHKTDEVWNEIYRRVK